ncbi:DUF6299 family protein [Streptomyces sp. NPDC051018]|uniref:DUF6299 family protein n=1 Tax=Streptomyces sp. NPDC051018 TaxID=3365639 RepID=UPI003798AF60
MIITRRATLALSLCTAAVLGAGPLAGTAGAQFAADTVTIDPGGRIDGAGAVTLTGAYRCSPPRAGTVLIGSAVVQGDSRADLEGSVAICDGRVHGWRGSGSAGKALRPGPARGEVTLLELDTSRGLPFPVMLGTGRGEVTLHRG